MSEVQNHGIAFEDIKIKEYTGLSKKEYDKKWYKIYKKRH